MSKAYHIIPKRFEAVIGAKAASTKYWAMNTYVYAIYLFFHFVFVLNLQRFQTNFFHVDIMGYCL